MGTSDDPTLPSSLGQELGLPSQENCISSVPNIHISSRYYRGDISGFRGSSGKRAVQKPPGAGKGDDSLSDIFRAHDPGLSEMAPEFSCDQMIQAKPLHSLPSAPLEVPTLRTCQRMPPFVKCPMPPTYATMGAGISCIYLTIFFLEVCKECISSALLTRTIKPREIRFVVHPIQIAHRSSNPTPSAPMSSTTIEYQVCLYVAPCIALVRSFFSDT